MESFERREKLALVYDNYSPRIIKMHLNKIKKEEEGGQSREGTSSSREEERFKTFQRV